MTEPDNEVVSGVTDILEHIAQPNTTKRVDSEGEFFFNIISSMMDFNSSSLNSKVGNQTQSSSSRYSSLLPPIKTLFISSVGLQVKCVAWYITPLDSYNDVL